MPAYHARGVSVRLGTLPLSDAITRTIVARKGETARHQSEAAEKKLRKSKLLTEQSVPFPGDDHDFGLNWLGNAPFMQAQIAQTNTNPAYAGKCDRRGDALGKPEALVLHLKLSDKTFVSGLDKAKTSLKIDIFFNGQLASCVFIPTHDVRSGAKSLHQVFAGTRVDYLSERPWVFLRTRSTTEVCAKDLTAASPIEQRWQDICQTLQREAQARGMDLNGNISPSAEFLESLAAMQMPRQVHGMQRPGGMHFGVIDVIITAGDGRKTTSGAGYLKAPQRLTDDNFPLNANSSNINKQGQVLGVGGSSSIALDPVSDDVDAAGESESDIEPQAKRRALTPRVLSMDQDPAKSNPFSGLQTPSLPPPARSSLVRSPPSSVETRNNHVSSLPIEPNHGHVQHSEPPTRHYTDYSNGHGQGQSRNGAIWQGESHSVQPEFAVSGPKSTPPLLSSPWGFWGNSPMLQQPLYPNSTSFAPVSNGHQSSPLQHIGPNPNGPLQLLRSSPSVSTGHDIRQHRHQYAYPVHQMPDEHGRRNSSVSDTLGSFPGHDFLLQPRLDNFTTAPVAPMFPWVKPARPPHTPNSMPHCTPNFPVSLPFLPFNSPITSELMPPTALFTVPAKPKTNVGLNKTQGVVRSVKSCQSTLVTRLVVYGQNGTVIDHRWAIPQRVSLRPGGLTVGGRCSDETLTSTLPPEQPSVPDRLSLTSTSQNSANVATEGPEAQDVDMKDVVWTDQDPEPRSGTLCHAGSGSGILGVQGPKATTFWFDDPEEILRGSSRQRRSNSPTKRKDRPVKLTHSKLASSSQSLLLTETATSSPLSSAPTTPEPGIGFVAHPSVQPILQLSHRSERRMPQADGPSESAAIHPSIPSPATPSSSDGLSSTVLQQSARLHLTPAASQSQKTKKRKASTQSVTRKRNHDRIIEFNDPPLNKNCVIAYSDVETIGAKTGPLRQVKSERQGVFQEDYVIFAARFFVPGN